MRTKIVYLLHFDRPILNARVRYTAGVQHYIGSTSDLDGRLADHRAGIGARLPQVFAERGIGFECVKTWRGGRQLERKIKKQKHAWRHCPICRAERRPNKDTMSLPIEVPRHCGPGVPAPCGCMWESGTWYPCARHATPHSQHTAADPAPGCDLCETQRDEARGAVADATGNDSEPKEESTHV